MTINLTHFDIADYLDNEKIIAEYLSAIMAEGDSSLLMSAIGDVAKYIYS